MISCRDIKTSLWDYYDGECSPSTREAVEQHLARCKGCQLELDQWVDISQRAFARTPVQAPPFLWTRVLAGIEQQEQESAPWWIQWRWMTGVTSVASVVVSLAALYVFTNAAPSLEALLDGHSAQQQAIQLASMPTGPDQSAGLVLGGEQ